ncbi:MAG TPA: efflux RND transporter periplasmic adaptor subunit [Gemmatimonadota bacterium]|nr:efflux RND transporter periplasmic adaptor subunit [Gemmatimonadota bacterium]
MTGWLGRVGLQALAASVLACAGEEAGGRSPGPGGPGEQSADRIVPVETARVESSVMSRSVMLSGVVEPLRTVGVNSQLASTVRFVGAEEGDRVAAGDVLARLDAAEIEAQVASAEAAYDVARSAWERAQSLRDEQIITLPEYERDRAAFAVAEAQREQLRTRLGYATIRSPLSGVVLEKNVEAGDLVAPQRQLFRVADISTLVIHVGVSELDVVDLAEEDTVGVTLDAYPDRPIRGRIRRVFPAADPETRLVPVEVSLEPGSLAKPGFLARVRLLLDVRAQVPLVPAGAIVEGEGGEAVFVVEGGQARRRSVRLGLTQEGKVEIVDGVAPGEVVVVRGNSSLRDGALVRSVGAP